MEIVLATSAEEKRDESEDDGGDGPMKVRNGVGFDCELEEDEKRLRNDMLLFLSPTC